MKKRGIEKTSSQIFCVMCGIVMAVLFYCSMRASWINSTIWEEMVYKRADNIALNILGILIGTLVVWGAAGFLEGSPVGRRTELLAVVVGMLCTAIAFYWIHSVQTRPIADQGMIVEYAQAFANGDISSLLKGGYVANYPQQLGLITFMRILYKVGGQGNYKLYQYFNACMVFVIVYASYRIVGYLTRRNSMAEIACLSYLLCCAPMYGYVPYVYGEIASVGVSLVAVWMLLSVLEQFRWKKVVFLAVACGTMVQFRKNTMICVIAFLIVIGVKMLQKPGKEKVVIGAGVLAGVVGLQLCVSAIYAPYIGEDAEPIPAILFVAMGTHYSEWTGAGSHDAYDWDTYEKYDYDPVMAKQAAWQNISEFVDRCKADPQWIKTFYGMKIGSQWNTPMYQCLAMNTAFYGGPNKLAHFLYFEEGGEYLETFMEIYQLLVYGGALCFLLWNLKGEKGIEHLVLMICIFGGFLFSIIWEAKARYIFPYFMMMIPCAVAGLSGFWEYIWSKIR